jgi:hypothetical protein
MGYAELQLLRECGLDGLNDDAEVDIIREQVFVRAARFNQIVLNSGATPAPRPGSVVWPHRCRSVDEENHLVPLPSAQERPKTGYRTWIPRIAARCFQQKRIQAV